MADEWQDVAFGPPSTDDGWQDVAIGPAVADEGITFGRAAKQVGNVVARGILGTPGFLYDVGKAMLLGPDVRREEETGEYGMANPLAATTATEEALDTVLPKRDPQYRYITTPFEFVTPSAGLKALGKAGARKLAQREGEGVARHITRKLAERADRTITPGFMASDVAAGLGAEAAADITGDRTIAPLIGAVGAGSVASAYQSGRRSGQSLLRGANEEEIAQQAGKVLRDVGGDTGDRLAASAAQAAPEVNVFDVGPYQVELSPLPLTKAEAAVEREAINNLAAGGEGLIDKYLDSRKTGRIWQLDADEARPLVSDSNLAKGTHEAASALNKAGFKKLIEAPDSPTEVRIFSGGPGSGKSHARKSLGKIEEAIDYEKILKSVDQGSEFVEEALSRGKDIQVVHVDVDPEVALERAWERALKSGRAVPLQNFENAALDSSQAIIELAEKYTGNQGFEAVILDNTKKGVEPRRMTVEELAKTRYNRITSSPSLEERLKNKLNQLYENTTKRTRTGSARADRAREIRSQFLGAEQEVPGVQQALYGSDKRELPDSLRGAKSRAEQVADPFARFRSTAEVTGNPALAQFEKELGGRTELAPIYGQRRAQRAEARDRVIASQTTTKGVPDDFGDTLIDAASQNKAALGETQEKAWDLFPRYTEVDTTQAAAAVKAIEDEVQAPARWKSDAKLYRDQFYETADPKGSIPSTSGALQEIRGNILKELRDNQSLPNHHRKVLSEISNQIEDTLNTQLTGTDAANYRKARDITKYRAETYAPRTVGGKLTNAQTLPETALKQGFPGSKRGAVELKKAVGNNRKVIEDYKRVILDEIPRDAQGGLTPARFKNYLQKKKTGWIELYGKRNYQKMNQVLEDLQSEANVSNIAYYASRGQSATQQKQTVAGVIDDLFRRRMEGNGVVSLAIEKLAESVGSRDQEQLRGVLFDALLEPKLFRELVKKPEPTRIASTVEALWEFVDSQRQTAAREATLGGFKVPTAENRSSPSPQGSGEETDSSRLRNQETRALTNSRSSSQPRQGGLLGRPRERTGLLSRPPQSSPGSLYGGKKNVNVQQVEALIDEDPIDAAIYETESNRDPKAKNKNSTAAGGFQLVKAMQKSLGVKDPYDLEQNYKGYRKLRAENERTFGSGPFDVYAAHYFGAPMFKRYLAGDRFTPEEQLLVDNFEKKALPRFSKIYDRIIQQRGETV